MKKLGVKHPILSIFIRPKMTIRAIVDFDPNYGLFYLSFIYGFGAIMQLAQRLALGNRLNLVSIIIPAFVLAALLGYVAFSISSWFVFHIGRWIGGKATFKQIRSAAAWSCAPLILNVVFWVLLIILFGNKLFQTVDVQIVFASKSLLFVLITILIILLQVTVMVWSLVIYICALAAVQHFSILKSIGNIVLTMLAITIISFIIVAAFKWTCSYFFDEPILVNIGDFTRCFLKM